MKALDRGSHDPARRVRQLDRGGMITLDIRSRILAVDSAFMARTSYRAKPDPPR